MEQKQHLHESFPENLYSIIVIFSKSIVNILHGLILKPFFRDCFYLRDNIIVKPKAKVACLFAFMP